MQKGSSLIEIVVYIACCILICSLTGHMLLTVQTAAQARIESADGWIELALAFNRLLDDVKQAPANTNQWKERNSHMLIFPLDAKDCGWFVDQKRLIRVTGKYNPATHHWSERATSIILDSIESLSLRYRHYSLQELAGVKVTLTKKNGTSTRSLEGFIAFRMDRL